MKLVHAADIHLDSPMHGLAAYDGAPVEELRLAARRAFSGLVDLCLAERADALTIGGDLYDGDWHDYATGAFFAREAARLAEADIPVVVVTGNHDAASRITRSLRLPESVHVLPVDAPGSVVLDGLGLAVHGQGYATPVVSADLSADYPAPVSGLVNVGLLHTSADGKFDHAPYAPCRVERLAERGYDFWGLGHVHERALLWADPPILFPGCLQGRSVRETGPKGATIVTFGTDGRPLLEERVLDVVRWAVVDVDASELADVDEVALAAASALSSAVEDAEGRLLAARVRVVGASPAHAALLRDARRFAWDLRAAAGDGAWIEKVQVRTTPVAAPALDADDALASLGAAIADADVASLAEELAPLAARLPVTLDWDPADPAVVRALLEDVERELPALLLDGGTS
ncbi:MAG TPA: DNA repair exonuclease [Baekduia sp.]|uniref:metallophosphoesterase family protein n=1 Tax=Baekduia sp. TaxID=2600305 RepID=UPI002D79A6A0|nr:DNA repair exonuclease [Baekduia sp.]HET6508549.1 DNA repair exonuclease [Baekduia sp.]